MARPEGAHLRREIRPQNHPDRIDRLNELVAAATADLSYVTTVSYRAFVGEIGTARERDIRDDGVHLSVLGARLLVEAVLPRVLDIAGLPATELPSDSPAARDP